jgi:hypothetical protein
MVPDGFMSAYILICDIIRPLPYVLTNLTVDQWIEIDYLHLFYVEEEVYRNESKYISELFANASSVIDWVEEEGFNASNLQSLYSMAENNWTHFRLPQTRKPLDDILSQVENFEVGKLIRDKNLFVLAEEEIQRAIVENRDKVVFPMNNSLNFANKYWNEQDFIAAQIYLDTLFRWAEKE